MDEELLNYIDIDDEGMWIHKEGAPKNIIKMCENHNAMQEEINAEGEKLAEEYFYKLKNGLIKSKKLDMKARFFDDNWEDYEEDDE